MDLGLKDRVAIVSGSSRGVGRAIAQAFVREGANVTVCALNDEALRRTEIELASIGSQHHVLAIPADLSVARDIRRVVRDTFNRFDQIGILVTHVGDSVTGPATEFEDEANATLSLDSPASMTATCTSPSGTTRTTGLVTVTCGAGRPQPMASSMDSRRSSFQAATAGCTASTRMVCVGNPKIMAVKRFIDDSDAVILGEAVHQRC